MSKSQPIVKIFKDGIWYKNPVFVQLLALCPTLAVSVSLKNALGLGACLTFVVVFSNFFISLFKKFISPQIRIVSYITIIAGFVTVTDILLKAYFPVISKSLGIFIPLIVVNCIVLARAESFASKNNCFLSVIDGLATGIGFTFALFVLSFVRMVLGTGTIFGFNIFTKSFPSATLMLTPVGAFLTLGFLVALFNFINDKRGAK